MANSDLPNYNRFLYLITQKIPWRLKMFSIALYVVFGSLLFSLASCGGMLDDHLDRVQDSIYQSQINAQQKQLQDSLRQR